MVEHRYSEHNLQLWELIKQHFSLDELKELCFNLGINYESIPGENTIDSKSRELVIYVSRRGQLTTLISALKEKRPHVNWPSNNNQIPIASLQEEEQSGTQLLRVALSKWESNNAEVISLSRASGQAAAVAATITVIGTLLFLAIEENQDQPEILFLVFVSLLFAGAAFVLTQIWARILIAAYFIVEQSPFLLQIILLTIIGGVTGFIVFFTMLQTYDYSWVLGVVSGLALALATNLHLKFRGRPSWMLPLLAALLTMLISFLSLVYWNHDEIGNAFGVAACGVFTGLFIHKLMTIVFLMPESEL